MFRCRHLQADAIIGWRINGSPIALYPDITTGSIQDSDGMRVDTLNIPAIPEYNGTMIEYFAAFVDGSPTESTPSVTLIITGLLKLLQG